MSKEFKFTAPSGMEQKELDCPMDMVRLTLPNGRYIELSYQGDRVTMRTSHRLVIAPTSGNSAEVGVSGFFDGLSKGAD